MNTMFLAPVVSAVFTGQISGNVLTVTALKSGLIMQGALVSGPGVIVGTQITTFPAGGGGIGNYGLSQSMVVSSIAMSCATQGWGITLDANGNIAVASGAYALAQDVASACRLFLGELWYNTTAGIPYDTEILGEALAVPYLTGVLQNAALTVPGVVSAKAYITGISGRAVTGQIQFVDSTGAAQGVIL